jgi:hypothetical protein
MTHEGTARQFSFRLPERLVERLDRCAATLQESGLDLTRTEVVRLLLNHALETTECRIDRLLRKPNNPRSA